MRSWSHACCDACWFQRHHDREPVRVLDSARAICCFCGRSTVSGIYVRVDPRTVPHPNPDVADD